MGGVRARLDHGKRIYDLDKDFSHNSALTLTLRPKNLIKVTAHPSPKGTLLWVKFGPDWVKGREDMLWTSDRRWKDRKTD